ncbi:hypothetical protein LUZ60_011839 [Juncus effusus]|nr:hypothetical protein LUZ60_011839 [Juncus effusus]
MENDETVGDEGDSNSWMDLPLSSGSRGNNKKRFSEDQIKSLESMFQTQTKLEPRQKLQLAKELNLEPRQVAIWFQNKRARWKSKKLEREYSVLKSEYDTLLSGFESLKKEKQMLLKQVQKLAEMLEKQKPGGESGNSNHSKNGKTTAIRNDSFTPPPCSESDDHDKKLMMCLSDQDEQDLYMWQRGEGRLNSGDEVQMQFSLQSTWPSSVDPLYSTQQSNSQWWDFWPIIKQ